MTSVSRTPIDPEQKFKLRVPCVECRAAISVPFPIEKDAITYLADEHRWYPTVLSDPGTREPIVLGLLCSSCAVRIYPPEVLKAAEEARDRRRLS